ncbi:MAG: SRPBCC family protein [Acidimicrobiales bacterium]
MKGPLQVAAAAVLGAGVERCFACAADVAAYPRWIPEIVAVDLGRLDGGGRALEATFLVEALGRGLRTTLRYDYGDAPRSFAWRQSAGDLLAAFEGRYEFTPALEDPESTEVSWLARVELAADVPAFVLRRAETRAASAALDGLRRALQLP